MRQYALLYYTMCNVYAQCVMCNVQICNMQVVQKLIFLSYGKKTSIL